ncbi:MAG TPA: divergent polysaccharide deacetylase family protein [Kiloniellales bacterium]|nr:divergent polysaccharide deacetylase family protein [Kiloniellales bacterium]
MIPEPTPSPRSRFGRVTLAAAWLLLVATLAGVAGYVLVVPAEPTAEVDSGIEIALPRGETTPPPPMQAEPEPAGPPASTAETETPVAPAPEPSVAERPSEPEETAPSETAPSETGPQIAALPPAEQPWRRFSQPFAAESERPRIAVVLTGLGLSSAMTEAAIRELPAGVTLSFTPYSRDLDRWVSQARAQGHEVLLDLPMEPTSYPQDDPGPRALLTALSERQNLERLEWILGRAEGYVGVAIVMGSRFVTAREQLEPVVEALKARGLMLLDNRSSDNTLAWALARTRDVPAAINDRILDSGDATRVTIEERLRQLERIARSEHYAVAMGHPYPATIDSLKEWLRGLEDRKLLLAPLTALANRQPLDKELEQSVRSQ